MTPDPLARFMKEGPLLLLRRRNGDGGWGAEEGRPSDTESTAIALTALASLSRPSLADGVEHGLEWLRARQQPEGSWPVSASIPARAWTTALAVTALLKFPEERDRALHGARWLLRQEGRALGLVASILYRLSPHSLATQLNPDLRGWSWTPNTFSWVEPTAYALIALKRASPYLARGEADHRIAEGERLLYDRMCAEGGWNYGNSETLGVAVPPFPDITAVALIALQDRPSDGRNQNSLRKLERMLGEVRTGLTLGWATICFNLYGREVRPWRQFVGEAYHRTAFLGLTKPLALALLAASEDVDTFRVPAHA